MMFLRYWLIHTNKFKAWFMDGPLSSSQPCPSFQLLFNYANSRLRSNLLRSVKHVEFTKPWIDIETFRISNSVKFILNRYPVCEEEILF